MGRKSPNIEGQKFGRLQIIRKVNPLWSSGHVSWECLCDCGNTTIAASAHLLRGNTRSCGCLQKEINIKRSTTHGMAHTPEYETWCRAKRNSIRCKVQFSINPEDIHIPDFCPVLGIKIKRNIGGGPGDSSPSLDRIFPERGYVQGNVRVISQRANRIKNDATAEELEKILEYARNFEIFAYA